VNFFPVSGWLIQFLAQNVDFYSKNYPQTLLFPFKTVRHYFVVRPHNSTHCKPLNIDVMSDQREPMENQDSQMNRGFESGSRDQQRNSGINEASDSGRINVSERGQGSSNRGFAAMSPERQRQIASEGGRAAHKQGVAHEWNKEEARNAGRKGGQSVSQNREHMSEIGRKGGQSSGGRRNRNQQNEGEGRG
jgi:general stress protein YciG